MILNMTGGGQSIGNMVETSFRLSANHYFYPGNRKNYLEIPNIQLSGNRVNTVLIYLNSDQTDRFGNGCIYNLFHTLSSYDTGVYNIDGRAYYIDPNSGSFGNSTPFHTGDGCEFLYDAADQKVKIFLPFYSNNLYLLGGFTYNVAIW